MPQDFLQQITLLLIGLLFAKDLITAFARKKGWINGDNDRKEIEELHKHAEIANEEMGQVKERLTTIEIKLEILMKHFNL